VTKDLPEQDAPRDATGSAAVASSLERVTKRLGRLEQQVRAFKELHVAEVSDLARRLQTIVRLHDDELQLILDQLADLAGELESRRDAEPRGESAEAGSPPAVPAAPGDPAARSPKRARWLAEEERRAGRTEVSRRELLLGRGEDS
jgi:hypothetical protein